ncbi:MAG: chemotaxis-specific protein-glutamate methyltransferase CheB [Myxococcales bacterium]|nr:chemotaxis-specific protein-glutamate methyltransferase CheB [Myxococcales bacterium]
MSKIRVLVVDDSVLARRFVSDALSAQEDFEVAGIAAHGRIALAKLPILVPDAVTLDLVMPEMDGIETLRELRRVYPKLPVVVFSSSSASIAQLGSAPFPLGPTEIVQKPDGMSPQGTPHQAMDALISSIRALCGRRKPSPVAAPSGVGVADVSKPAEGPRPSLARALGGTRAPVSLLAIGSSTGGPNALEAALSGFTSPPPVPVVITQHMPPYFTGLLATRLTNACRFTVVEAKDGDVLLPGRGYVAPGDYHMAFVKEGNEVRVKLNQGPPENSCRPAVDVMFRSIASIYGGRVLACVLTGMGQDGLRGAGALKEAGGQVIVQDEASSVVWGMPGFIARAGLADAIVPLSGINDELTKRLSNAISFDPAMRVGVSHAS